MLPEVEAAWAEEVARRLNEIDSGAAVLIPREDIRRQLWDGLMPPNRIRPLPSWHD